LFALCTHCGAVIARHREAIEGATTMVRRMYLALVTQDEQASRILALMTAQEAARTSGDRSRYEALVTESLLLELADDPSRVPPHAKLANWVRMQVTLRTLTTFEPDLVAGFPHLPVSRFEADAITAGTAHLAALRAWASRVLDHPSFPVELRGELAVDTLTVDAYRIALGGAAPMLSARALTDALSVLGAGDGTCRTCGGAYTQAEAASGACPWCRAAIDAELAHPWVQALARIARAVLAVPRPEQERMQIAMQLVESNAMTTKKAPPPELVAAYLRAVFP